MRDGHRQRKRVAFSPCCKLADKQINHIQRALSINSANQQNQTDAFQCNVDRNRWIRAPTLRFGRSESSAPTAVRVEHARRLLERTDLSVDQVAHRSGLGTAANLRERLAQHTGLTPTVYRRTFAA